MAVQAWFVVAAVRLLLGVVPYRWLEARCMRPRESRPGTVDHAAIALGVTRASTMVPAATCLTQALAGAFLIHRAGGRATIQFGVARDTAGFKAHAWLEGDGRILIGGATAASYQPLVR